MTLPQKEKTLRELIKENQSRIWWEEEPAPNNFISIVKEWLLQKQKIVEFGAYMTDLQVSYQSQLIDELLEDLEK